ncbi:bifunctional ADP-dependent NAD(P)H-hydrate dehydratase/NAD(P)H-hydrate epimerase [Clostridium grantii]|uniref:Bifunctional NAD(P)H-hydrate repair enzyme n=1 Tax=Clostridium grantii DSM 8605 TaxID=1121316 RepID=A0A1M5U4E9_9CLOT|nr:bifunctional ADP-dependent NAD(P)H-hydrate dehydratase/NAD(P)H-hydrate epimerase [Clostridium grantii]SHH57839.1 NAD(P)H-hydrate epimerase [Clostridium grantii DSM 8605]
MILLKSDRIKQIDKYCINKIGIPGIVLMENAALKVLKNIEEKFKSFIVVCGVGNNGGDGFVVARHLLIQGKKVKVFIVGDITKMGNDCVTNFKIMKKLESNMMSINNSSDLKVLRDAIEENSLVIDAIFGTGLNRNVEGICNDVISTINSQSKNTISIDIPSGLNCDSGLVMGNAIRATKTITFQVMKTGFINYGAKAYTGNVVVENIGIPDFVIKEFTEDQYITCDRYIKKYLVKRNEYSHKGDFGKVFIIAGSKGYTGAAYITTEAAVRCGSGLVTLCCHEDIQGILSSKLVEAMTLTLTNNLKIEENIEKADVIALGTGLGDNIESKVLTNRIIKSSSKPMVIDADGINVLVDNLDILLEKKAPIVLTPHPGEFSRISGYSIEEITLNRISIAKEFANKYNIVLLLKGYNTIVTDGEKVYVNPTGNSAMASGGMGDCLTGIIASLIGQKIPPFEATYIAAYIHGYCGEKLSKEMFSVNAEHILKELPYVMKELAQD